MILYLAKRKERTVTHLHQDPQEQSPQETSVRRLPLSEAIRLRLHLTRKLQAKLLRVTPRTCRYWAKGIHRPLPRKLYQRLRQAHADHILQGLREKTSLPPFTKERERELEFCLLFRKLTLMHFIVQSILPGEIHELEAKIKALLVYPKHPYHYSLKRE